MIVHVAQRRLIQTLRLDLHGAPVERDELLRDADLAENGEVLGVDMLAYRARIEQFLARRAGSPPPPPRSPRARPTTRPASS